MSLLITGKTWKFGDDINTDYMAPGFVKNQPWELVKRAILHIHPGFTAGFQPDRATFWLPAAISVAAPVARPRLPT